MPSALQHLLIGDVLQLQHVPPSDNPDRFAVKLIGYLSDQSLIITTPRKQGKSILVREGQVFAVRLLQGSNIFGFVSRVLNTSSKPYPHLHLAYPEDVESAVIRNAPRVTISLSAKVRNTRAEGQQTDNNAAVIDLSSTGVRLSYSERLGAVGEMLQLQLLLEVCGGRDTLQVLGYIRNIREIQGEDGHIQCIHGVQFKGLNRFQQVLLCAFVLEGTAKARE